MRQNRYINASYQLYDVTDGKKELLEETSAEQPFTFISGLGLLLDAFERQVENLAEGSNFDFILSPAQAYGEYLDEHVVELPKETFYIDGHFDEKNVYQGAVIPLQNEDGNRFNGLVTELTDEVVIVDLNHALAGRTLNFVGKIIENREPTNDELSQFVSNVTGQGGGCGCGGNCGCSGEDDGECCGGHHHNDGECCGGHHGGGSCGCGGK